MEDCAEDTAILDPAKVTAAHAEEVTYRCKRGVWDVVPIPPGIRLVNVR